MRKINNNQSSIENKPYRVLIVYHVFSHYRFALIRELMLDKDVQYFFMSGKAFNTSVPEINTEGLQKELIQWRTIKNIWLFNGKFLWQSGLLYECVWGDYDGIIFLGNPFFLSTWFAAVLSRLLNKKTYFWAHATVRDKFRDKLKLLFFKIPHGLLLYGNNAKKKFIELGFKAENIYVIYNSLDYSLQKSFREKIKHEYLQDARRRLFFHPDLPLLLFVGRLVARKQLQQLLGLHVELAKRGMLVNVLFVGDGPEEESLQKYIQDNKIKKYVTFYGACYDEEKLSILISMCDLCVSPGDVGLTAIHSLGYGTPVITHNNPFMQMPEYEAIQEGRNGQLYEYGSFDSLVDSVYIWLIENQGNRESLRRICYEVVDEKYNPTFQASAIKSAIFNLVKRKNEN